MRLPGLFHKSPGVSGPFGPGPGVLLIRVVSTAAFLTITSGVIAGTQNPTVPPEGLRMDRIDLPTAINQPPDANAQMEMRNRKLAPKHFAAANIQRRKQIVDDAATLLKLTRELKTEIDAITGDMPVAEIVRRAEAIERLARSVREKMKLVAGAT